MENSQDFPRKHATHKLRAFDFSQYIGIWNWIYARSFMRLFPSIPSNHIYGDNYLPAWVPYYHYCCCLSFIIWKTTYYCPVTLNIEPTKYCSTCIHLVFILLYLKCPIISKKIKTDQIAVSSNPPLIPGAFEELLDFEEQDDQPLHHLLTIYWQRITFLSSAINKSSPLAWPWKEC